MILTRTPLRVSLFGGGSDYPEHFNAHGGAVLGMAINKWTYLGVRSMPPGLAPRYRIVYSQVENVLEIDQIQHPAARGCLQHLSANAPLEITYSGDLAAGGGLGASSAFVVGLLHALRRQLYPAENVDFEACALAEEAIYVERDVICEAVGFQDQILAAYGGIQFIEFGPDNEWSINGAIKLSDDRRTELEQSLVLVYSGTMRLAHVMAAKQITRIDQNTDLIKHMAGLAATARELLVDHHEPLSTIGSMLDMSWRMKRGLHHEISTTIIDQLYEHGLSLGALGGKLCGAGGGGFLLFFVPPDKREHFEAHIGAPCVGFKIAQQGTHILVNEP